MINFIKVESPDGQVELSILPNKYKKLIWLKRGDYVILSANVDEDIRSTKDKIKYSIRCILNKEKIKYIKSMNMWY
jgi:probable RNA-binding protein EIF1AD